MAEILSQYEIDLLLERIKDYNLAGIDYSDLSVSALKDAEEFEKYLTIRQFVPEKPYGVIGKNSLPICRFFGSPDGRKNESLLEDIKRKNAEQGYGNVKIPNTNVTLINYSFCPKCKTIYSFKEVGDYYRNPAPDARYKNKAHQYRNDTRVLCNNCSTYFLPSLVISDGTPKNEVQFLCRAQTINAVEEYFLQKNKKVLTKNKKNIIQKGKLRAIKNDVYLKDLEEKPTLIVNMIQYTLFHLIMNLLDGTNVKKGDLLFDEWK